MVFGGAIYPSNNENNLTLQGFLLFLTVFDKELCVDSKPIPINLSLHLEITVDSKGFWHFLMVFGGARYPSKNEDNCKGFMTGFLITPQEREITVDSKRFLRFLMVLGGAGYPIKNQE
jgi:hypothetical protein